MEVYDNSMRVFSVLRLFRLKHCLIDIRKGPNCHSCPLLSCFRVGGPAMATDATRARKRKRAVTAARRPDTATTQHEDADPSRGGPGHPVWVRHRVLEARPRLG